MGKTIIEQLQDIGEEMCNNYCKWPDLWDEDKEGVELCESEQCKSCPLNRL